MTLREKCGLPATNNVQNALDELVSDNEQLKDEIEYLKQKLFWKWIFFLYGIGVGIGITSAIWFWNWINSI